MNRLQEALDRLEEAGKVISSKNLASMKAIIEAIQSAMSKLLELAAKGEKQKGKALEEAGSQISTAILEARRNIEGSLELLMDRVRSAVRAKYPYQGSGSVIADTWLFATFSDHVIVEQGGKYYKLSYTDSGSEIKLGDAVEVSYKQTFEEISEALIVEAEKLIEEMTVDEIHESEALNEDVEILEAKDSKGFKWAVRLIKEGRSKNPRSYPRQTLVDAAPLFEGTKAYDGHDTSRRRSSSTKNLVGVYEGVGVKTKGNTTGLYATLSIIENDAGNALRKTLLGLKKIGRMDAIGVSIDALGKTKIVRTTGGAVALVEKIHKVNSVDIVADPAAGGQFERLIASMEGENLDKLKQLLEMLNEGKTLAETKEAHPDWFDNKGDILIEGVRFEDIKPNDDGNKNNDGTVITEAQYNELKEAIELSKCETMLATQLTEANLPKIMKEKIQERFAEKVFTKEELEAAIKESNEIYAAFEKKNGLLKGFGSVQVTEEEHDRHKLAMDAFFEGKAVKGANDTLIKPFMSLKEAYLTITGKHIQSEAGLSEAILQDAYRFNRMTESGNVKELIRESITTSTFGELLGDSITRKMVKDYNLPDLAAWREVVSSIVPISDFRTQRRMRMGGYGNLPAVGQGSPYQPLTSPTDEEATYSISKRGGTEDLTLETIANDDVGAIRRIPTSLGRAAARTLYQGIFDILKDNETIYDSTALFTSGHGNLGSTALAHAALTAIRQFFREVTNYGATDVLMLNLFRLFVPAELEETAFELTQQLKKSTNEDSTLKNINSDVDYRVIGYWTDATDYVATANPVDIPMIEVGFYQGKEDPELFIQDNPNIGSVFDADKVTYKIRHIWGKAVLDYRGFYKQVVAG